MPSTQIARDPSGIPTGGRFAVSTKPTSGVALYEDLFGDQGAAPDAFLRADGPMMAGNDYSYANLEGGDLRNARAQDATFLSANLKGANLAGIDATGADFRKADLSGANLDGGSFDGADFRDARLGSTASADLTDANLEQAVIGSADNVSFNGANLREATLSGHFERCDFRGADFGGTTMTHSPIRRSEGMSDATFLDCRFDDEPINGEHASWPNGFDPELNGRFRRGSIDADEQAEWQDAGVGDPEIAAGYRAADFTPKSIGDWHEAFEGNYRAARSFADVDMDPWEAKGFHAKGLPADTARDYRRRGFLPYSEDRALDVTDWHGEFGDDAAAAASWAGKRYTAAEARQLMDLGRKGPSGAHPPARETAIEARLAELRGRKMSAAQLNASAALIPGNWKESPLGSHVDVEVAAINRLIAERRTQRS